MYQPSRDREGAVTPPKSDLKTGFSVSPPSQPGRRNSRRLRRGARRGWLEADAPEPDRFDGRGGLCGTSPARPRANLFHRRLCYQALLESLSFFPDGNTLVSAGRDSFVKFWTIPNAALFRAIATQAVPLQVAVSPDGNHVAVAMAAGHLDLWSADGATRRALVGHTDAVNGIAAIRKNS